MRRYFHVRLPAQHEVFVPRVLKGDALGYSTWNPVAQFVEAMTGYVRMCPR